MHPRDRLGSIGKPTPSAAPAIAAQDASALAGEQLAAVRQYIAQLGGLENARKALDLLAILSAAAETPGPSTG